MTFEEYNAMAARGEYIGAGSERHIFMHSAAQRAIDITGRINGGYHPPAELRALFSELIGQKVDEGFGLFPPFYTDYGRNIRVGKRVFISSACSSSRAIFPFRCGISVGQSANMPLPTFRRCLKP